MKGRRGIQAATQGHDAPVGVAQNGKLIGQFSRNGILAKRLNPHG